MPRPHKAGRFTLQTHQMFSVYITPEEFRNKTITGHVIIVTSSCFPPLNGFYRYETNWKVDRTAENDKFNAQYID